MSISEQMQSRFKHCAQCTFSFEELAWHYALMRHKNERTKYVIGPYHWHLHGVRAAMNTAYTRALGSLHDTIESELKKRLGKKPGAQVEERFIKLELRRTQIYFSQNGYNANRLCADLDVLTFRSHLSYDENITRLIDYAKRTGRHEVLLLKLADIKNNSRPERYPPAEKRTPKENERYNKYTVAQTRLENALVEVNPSAVLNKRHGEAIVNGAGLNPVKKTCESIFARAPMGLRRIALGRANAADAIMRKVSALRPANRNRCCPNAPKKAA